MAKFFKGCLTLIGGFFVLMMLVGILANVGKSRREAADRPPAARQPARAEAPAAQAEAPAETAVAIQNVQAATLLKTYENNKLKAEQTYQGRRLRVSGIVSAIGSDILDQPYITLGTGASFEVTQLQCFFSKQQASQLARLDKGQSLQVEGTVDGYVMNVLLKDCRLAGGKR